MTVTDITPKAVEKPATIAQITEAGVYDIPAEVYHRDPVKGGSLSSSGARRILPPSCPALFWHERKHGTPRKKAWDFGTAAHSLVLGTGAQVVEVDADSWRTNDAKQQKAEIEAAGGVAVLPFEMAVIEDMAAALMAHPLASSLLARDRGLAEQTLVWRDAQTGVWRRALLDWLPHGHSGRMILADYKTTRDASPTALAKAVHDYGYGQQAQWYLDGVVELGLAGPLDPAFVFVFQEKSAPYLVTVAELDAPTMRIAAAKNRAAMVTFADCMRRGHWPGYSDDVVELALPTWAEAQDTEVYL